MAKKLKQQLEIWKYWIGPKTHTLTWFFMVYGGLSIGNMIFILYKLYFLLIALHKPYT